jgi:hypothetical protein
LRIGSKFFVGDSAGANHVFRAMDFPLAEVIAAGADRSVVPIPHKLAAGSLVDGARAQNCPAVWNRRAAALDRAAHDRL